MGAFGAPDSGFTLCGLYDEAVKSSCPLPDGLFCLAFISGAGSFGEMDSQGGMEVFDGKGRQSTRPFML